MPFIFGFVCGGGRVSLRAVAVADRVSGPLASEIPDVFRLQRRRAGWNDDGGGGGKGEKIRVFVL